MITLNDVILECFSNFMLFIFAILIYRHNRFAWLFALVNVLLVTYLSAKYSILSSLIYMSAQIISVIIAYLMWFNKPEFKTFNKLRAILTLLLGTIVLSIWIFLMYLFVNPYILGLKMLFGFGYLTYMLFVLGCIFVAFRLSTGLLVLATVFISKSFYYSQTVVSISNAPINIKQFTPYFVASACCMFLSGVFLVIAYTKVKKSNC